MEAITDANEKKKILLCDDDSDIVESMSIYLIQEGYDILKAYDGMEAADIIKVKQVDLLVIDIMMPKMDGLRTIMKLREQDNPLPVIVISAKSEDTDKILGLNVGADDYITKPFNMLELIARINSQLRRYGMLEKLSGCVTPALLINGGLCVDDDRKEVLLDGSEVKLTPTEYNILLFLLKNKGKVFSSTQIYDYVWSEDSFGAESSVAVHIRHIREKIEITPSNPRYIKVVWGVGYKMEDLA